MLIIFILVLIHFRVNSSVKSDIGNNNKIVDIYDVVKEAFLTDKGYSNELSKHMTQEVFKRTNIYNAYPVNNPEYKKPYKVDFSLKEDSQNIEKDIVYVKMIYSVTIKDSQNKIVGGSWDIPITFTVKKTGNEWYIIDKDEPS
jgi:hypothetical protein